MLWSFSLSFLLTYRRSTGEEPLLSARPKKLFETLQRHPPSSGGCQIGFFQSHLRPKKPVTEGACHPRRLLSFRKTFEFDIADKVWLCKEEKLFFSNDCTNLQCDLWNCLSKTIFSRLEISKKAMYICRVNREIPYVQLSKPQVFFILIMSRDIHL